MPQGRDERSCALHALRSSVRSPTDPPRAIKWRIKAEEVLRYEQNHRGVTKETARRLDYRPTGKRAADRGGVEDRRLTG